MDFGRPEAVPIRSQSIPQTIETPVSFTSVPNGYVRYAYARSSDSMNSQIEGQDYLCFKHNDQRLVFVVADGVGSSFCGNLAARILGDNLMEWLWSLDVTYLGGHSALAESAASYLNRLQKQAQAEVNEYEIPDTVGGLIRQALESQRTYGSEAIFAAARIDHPNPMIPEGLLSIIWMGDTRVRSFHEEEGELKLGGITGTSANRWSTAQGVRGEMSAYMRSLQGVSRVIAYSDGLSAHEDRLDEYADTRLDQEIRAGSRLPSSDDVSFFDVVLRTPLYEGYPDPDLPDPNLDRPGLEQIWNPTGSDSYELRWNWRGGQKTSFIIQESRSPSMAGSKVIEVPGQDVTAWKVTGNHEPGVYYYRVRAVTRWGTVSPWSELRQTKVAFPPPPAPVLEPIQEGTSPLLQWSEEGDSLDYVVVRSSESDPDHLEIAYEGRGTSWVIPMNSLKPGTYTFRVKAISDGGESEYSASQMITITLPPPPRPSLGSLGHDPASNSLLLRWQAVSGATRYEVAERNLESDEETVFETGETIFQMSLDTHAPGDFGYRVRACHDYGCSEWSEAQGAAIAPPLPGVAPFLTVEGPDESRVVHLTWTEVPMADEYLVEAADEPDFVNARLYTTTDLSYDLPRSEPGGTYLRVCGSNPGGEGPWSNVEKTVILPATPAWIEAKRTESGHVTVNWGAVPGKLAYRLQMIADEGTIEVYRGEETHIDGTIKGAAGAVAFRVRAEAPGDVHSGWQLGEPLAPSGPRGPQISEPELGMLGEIHLRWNAVAGPDRYRLEVSQTRDFTGLLHAQESKDPETVFYPPAGGVYWFRVRMLNAEDLPGAPGEPVRLVVREAAAPRLFEVHTPQANHPLELAWSGMPGTDAYEIQESMRDSFPEDRTETLTRVRHPSQKITLPPRPPVTVYYRVRAISGSGKPGPWSNVIRVELQ